MIRSEKQVKTSRWLIVAIALAAMIGTGSFSIASLGTTSVSTLPVGESVDSKGTITALRAFQWKPDCSVTTSGITLTLAECSGHKVITKFTSATKGDTGTITIDSLQCFASSPTALRVKATVDDGLLVDFQDTADIEDPGPRVIKQHEWIAKVKNCSASGADNQVKIQIHVIKTGSFNFTVEVFQG